MSELATMTIHQLGPVIRRREVSPVQVAHEALDRVARLDERLRAFITVRPEQALAEARTAEEEIARGNYRGPLHGVPLAIKDNIAVAGWPTTNGSALMTDNVTDYDATVVQRLRGAGAVIVGKTNLHEWAMGGSCSNGPFGTVRNPWDETRVPGGSSGGSAAAVSASLVYGSVGTDGMGSIRTPSSYCGVIGLKPTYGLVSRFGELPPTSSTSDHLGPIAKDVRDAAILLNALAGHDPKDPTSIPSAPKDYTEGIDRGVAGLRVGVPQDFFFEEASPEVQHLVRQAIDVFGSLGAEIRAVRLPSVHYMPLVVAATSSESNAFLLPFALRGPQQFADQTIWERVIVGQLVRTADMLKAARLRSRIRQEFAAAMEEADILATPTNVTPAFPIDVGGTLPGGKPQGNLAITTTLTSPLNLVGMPALSVPCGFTSDGLPVGLMLAGRHWEDEIVLRAAHSYERAATGGYAIPPIAQAQAAPH